MAQWECVAKLEAEGTIPPGAVSGPAGLEEADDWDPEEDEEEETPMNRGGPRVSHAAKGKGARRYVATSAEPAAHDKAASAAFLEAHRWASQSRWLEAAEVLTCVSHTKALRRTGIGSSPAMWNFLDNVKAHIENPDLAAEVGIASGEEALAAALEASRAINPEGEDWESFGGADGEEEEREATGFDWEAWEAFAARNAAATRGECPSSATSRRDGERRESGVRFLVARLRNEYVFGHDYHITLSREDVAFERLSRIRVADTDHGRGGTDSFGCLLS